MPILTPRIAHNAILDRIGFINFSNSVLSHDAISFCKHSEGAKAKHSENRKSGDNNSAVQVERSVQKNVHYPRASASEKRRSTRGKDSSLLNATAQTRITTEAQMSVSTYTVKKHQNSIRALIEEKERISPPNILNPKVITIETCFPLQHINLIP